MFSFPLDGSRTAVMVLHRGATHHLDPHSHPGEHAGRHEQTQRGAAHDDRKGMGTILFKKKITFVS